MARNPPITKLTHAMKNCKGKKGCEYSSCMIEEGVEAPKWADKKGCNI